MRVGVAADHGGFLLKGELLAKLVAAGYTVIDFGADQFDASDDYPDFIVPLADGVATGWVDRGIALCSSGAGASICANKILGARAAVIDSRLSAHQAVEDDHLNILCLDGRNLRIRSAWEIVTSFVEAEFSQADHHLRRLGKVAYLEEWHDAPHYGV